MGFFNFGRKNKSSGTGNSNNASNPQATIQQLRESMANAEKREKHVQYQMANLVQEAKLRSAQGDKRGALQALQRKKLYQAELDKLTNVRMTLETQVIHIEAASYNQETVQAMKSGQSAMSRLRKKMGLDAVDTLMDDIREEADMAAEINNAIGTPLDPYMESDADLLAELEALEPTMSTTSPKKQSQFFSLPSVSKPNKTSNTQQRPTGRVPIQAS